MSWLYDMAARRPLRSIDETVFIAALSSVTSICRGGFIVLPSRNLSLVRSGVEEIGELGGDVARACGARRRAHQSSPTRVSLNPSRLILL